MKTLALALATFVLSLAAAAGPKPGPLDDPFLDNLVGKWKLTRKVHGTTVVNTLDVKWVLQHRFLQMRMKDVANPPDYEALVLIGYDSVNERYVAHWCDDFGGAYSAVGYGKRDGNSIQFRFEYPDGPFFNTFNWEPVERGWRMVLESSKDGKRAPFAEDTVRRR
jgi:hypothetical protein